MNDSQMVVERKRMHVDYLFQLQKEKKGKLVKSKKSMGYIICRAGKTIRALSLNYITFSFSPTKKLIKSEQKIHKMMQL